MYVWEFPARQDFLSHYILLMKCGVCSQGCYILILVAMKCVVCVVCAGQGCYILILVAMKCVVCAVRAVTNFGCSCVPA